MTLHDTWRTQARAAGLDPDRLTPTRLDRRPQASGVGDAMLIAEALHHVAEESSTWLRADIARHLAILIPAGSGATATEVVARIDRLATLAEAQCLSLAPQRPSEPARRDGRPIAEHVTDRRLTTPAVIDEETQLQHWAETNAREINRAGDDPQEAAAAAIAGTATLVVVGGPAGTGKTHTTARAVHHLRAQGRPWWGSHRRAKPPTSSPTKRASPVVGLAPSGKAADVLADEAGCPTTTLAGFLTQHPPGHGRRKPRSSSTRPPWPTPPISPASSTSCNDTSGA